MRLLEYKGILESSQFLDVHACGKALHILTGLVPILAENHTYHEIMGKNVLIKVLEVGFE
jgi:hypothetical protein